MRRVAPVKPAIAVNVNNSLVVNGKPTFNICTVRMLHSIHTPKPQSRLGMEIHRFRFAILLPCCCQKVSLSGSQRFKFDIVPLHANPEKVPKNYEGSGKSPQLFRGVSFCKIVRQSRYL
jgi:hypothetical protein